MTTLRFGRYQGTRSLELIYPRYGYRVYREQMMPRVLTVPFGVGAADGVYRVDPDTGVATVVAGLRIHRPGPPPRNGANH